jgi:hypothetical protein
MKKRIRLTEGDLHRIVKESVKRVLREMKGDDLEGQDLYDYVDSLNLNGEPDEEWSFDDWEQPEDEYLTNPFDANTVGEYNFAATTKDMNNRTFGRIAQDRHPQVPSDYGAKKVLGYDYNSPDGRAWMKKWNDLDKSVYKI